MSNENIFPIMYMSNLDNMIYWICDYDEDKKLTSMFFKRDDPERFIAYCTEEEAIKQRDLLIDQGWIKCKKPEMVITFDESNKPNRAQRRAKDKMDKKLSKK